MSGRRAKNVTKIVGWFWILLDTKAALVVNQIMNANIEIERTVKKTDMCEGLEKIKEKAAKEAAKEATILSAIEVYREMKISDDEIMNKITVKYNLSLEDATEYLSKKSA